METERKRCSADSQREGDSAVRGAWAMAQAWVLFEGG